MLTQDCLTEWTWREEKMENMFPTWRMLMLIMEINPLSHHFPPFTHYLSHFNKIYQKFEDTLKMFIYQERLFGIFEISVSDSFWRFWRIVATGFFSWGREKKIRVRQTWYLPFFSSPSFFPPSLNGRCLETQGPDSTSLVGWRASQWKIVS